MDQLPSLDNVGSGAGGAIVAFLIYQAGRFIRGRDRRQSLAERRAVKAEEAAGKMAADTLTATLQALRQSIDSLRSVAELQATTTGNLREIVLLNQSSMEAMRIILDDAKRMLDDVRELAIDLKAQALEAKEHQ